MNALPADEHGTFNITSKEEKMIERIRRAWNYHNKDNWDDFMNKCYEVLNVPCFSGKSFKDIIEDVVFES